MEVEIAESGPVPEAVRALLGGLPDWFGIPEAVEQYVADAQTLPTLVARSGGEIVGALLRTSHFPESAEIHLMAIAAPWHRRGIGRRLVARTAELVRADGGSLLSVKTLGPSDPDEHYAATRAFYRACGFVPVEELGCVWPGNPCLILVRPL